ncbi:MAG: type VI secretion system contractile sheath small subunit [Alcanivorax sp.]|nr:type VI secretion system contractile sheath small subunit [Alcanivorax sp.]
MSKSFQNELPRARVNITLDLETGGAKKKLELPLKLLVMGDYSNGQSEGRIAERERVRIDRNNVNDVLKDMAPRVRYTVENTLRDDGSDIQVDLKFDSFNSFKPEQVAQRIPQLNDMLAMRSLLKDLKSNLLDNSKFRRELERIVKTKPELEELMGELSNLVPLDAKDESGNDTDNDA